MLLFGNDDCQSCSNPGFDSHAHVYTVAYLDADSDFYAHSHLDVQTNIYFWPSYRYRNGDAHGDLVHDLDALADPYDYGDLSSSTLRHAYANHDVHPIADAHGDRHPNGDA